jgi:hypothetical protein
MKLRFINYYQNRDFYVFEIIPTIWFKWDNSHFAKVFTIGIVFLCFSIELESFKAKM